MEHQPLDNAGTQLQGIWQTAAAAVNVGNKAPHCMKSWLPATDVHHKAQLNRSLLTLLMLLLLCQQSIAATPRLSIHLLVDACIYTVKHTWHSTEQCWLERLDIFQDLWNLSLPVANGATLVQHELLSKPAGTQ